MTFPDLGSGRVGGDGGSGGGGGGGGSSGNGSGGSSSSGDKASFFFSVTGGRVAKTKIIRSQAGCVLSLAETRWFKWHLALR